MRLSNALCLQDLQKSLHPGWHHAPAAALPFRVVRKAGLQPLAQSNREHAADAGNIPGHNSEYAS